MSEKKKFLNFSNASNTCWLDATLTLIAHNKTFKRIVENYEDSEINEIITGYQNAIDIINGNEKAKRPLWRSKSILSSIQTKTLNYLKEFLKFKSGEPESAFCALLNLLNHDKSNIKEHLNTTWICNKQCQNCDDYSKSLVSKPIITLSKVKKFNPEAPVMIYTCSCKTEQEMKVDFKEISDCLIFHFENGTGKDKTLPLEFSINTRKYQLTSLMMYEKSKGVSKNHFITWIRQPFTEKWLECNDMKNTVIYFHKMKPELKDKNLYISIYEAFDHIGKTKNGTFSDESFVTSNINFELIDLRDEDEKAVLDYSSATLNLEMNEELASCDQNEAYGNSVKPEIKNDEKDVSSCPVYINELLGENFANTQEVKGEKSQQNYSSIALNLETYEAPDENKKPEKIKMQNTGTGEKDYICPVNICELADEKLGSTNEVIESKEDQENYSFIPLNEEMDERLASCDKNKTLENIKMQNIKHSEGSSSSASPCEFASKKLDKAQNIEESKNIRYNKQLKESDRQKLKEMVDRIVDRTIYTFLDAVFSKNNMTK